MNIRFLALCIISGLSACDSSDNDNDVDTDSESSITTDNAMATLQSAMSVAFMIENNLVDVDEDVKKFLVPDVPSASENTAFSTIIVSQVSDPNGPLQNSRFFNCVDSGSATFEFQGESLDNPDGTRRRMKLYQCEMEGITITGEFRTEILDSSNVDPDDNGLSENNNESFIILFEDLKFAGDEFSLSTDGLVSFSTRSLSNGQLSIEATSTYMNTVTGNTNGDFTTSFTNYASEKRIDLNSNTITFSTNTEYTLSTYVANTNDMSVSVNGSFVMKTLEPIMFDAALSIETPVSGKVQITAQNGSSATLTMQNSIDLLMEIDLDGDGSIDDTVNTNWSEVGIDLDLSRVSAMTSI